jgi:hypothetical protein
MAFIAQIPLKTPLLLSEIFDMAYVFMCCEHHKTGICASYDPYSGANAVFFQRGHEGQFGCAEAERFPEYAFELEEAAEPIVDTDDPAFENTPYDPAREAAVAKHGIMFGLYQDDFTDAAELVGSHTKLGGVPYWVQNNDAVPCPKCGGEMDLIAQIDSEVVWPERNMHYVRRAFRYLMTQEGEELRKQDKHILVRVDTDGYEFELVEPDCERKSGGVTVIGNSEIVASQKIEEIFPFGGGGVAYVFKCRRECSPTSGVFLWQTT